MTANEPHVSYNHLASFAGQLAFMLAQFTDRIAAAEGDYRHEAAAKLLDAYYRKITEGK